MRLNTFEEAIAKAKLALKISDSELAKLALEESELIVNRIEERFVDGHNWLWWWEHFSQMEVGAWHMDDKAIGWLNRILPELEAKVWFVVEPFGSQKGFSVYEAVAKHIQPILEECTFFEYYVVSKDLSWLIGENHHGTFFCVGDPVSTRLESIVEQNPEQWTQIS